MIRRSAILALVVALVIPVFLEPTAEAAGPVVTVLIDFGDGTYSWVDVGLPEWNVTAMKATDLASLELGLSPPEVTWFDEGFCLVRPCALVEDIGDRDRPWPAWWYFSLWNHSSAAWELAPVGPSDTNLTDGDVISWYLTVADPATYDVPRPVSRVDWRHVHTSFRGNVRNTGVAAGSIPGQARVLWDTDVGIPEIDTAPVVAYGKVFVAARTSILALDVASGGIVWRNSQVGSLLSTPAIYDGHLVFGGTDNRLHYLDAETGVEVWNVLLEGTLLRSTGVASSPTVFEGRAYVGTFNETEGGSGRVKAVNMNNGSVAWSYETASVHMSSPAIDGDALVVGLMGTCRGARCVLGYDPPYGVLSLHLNGTLNWFYPTDGPVAGSPMIAGGRVYVTSKDGFLHTLDLSGSLLWKGGIGPSTSSPAYGGDRIFVGSGGFNGTGAVVAFDDEGARVWEASPGGPVQASLVTDGELVCGATNTATGSVFCLRASDGTQVWRYTPSPNQYILGSPSAAGGALFVPSDNGHVYAFGVGVPTRPPDVPWGFVIVSLGFAALLIGVPVTVFLMRRRRGRDA